MGHLVGRDAREKVLDVQLDHHRLAQVRKRGRARRRPWRTVENSVCRYVVQDRIQKPPLDKLEVREWLLYQAMPAVPLFLLVSTVALLRCRHDLTQKRVCYPQA